MDLIDFLGAVTFMILAAGLTLIICDHIQEKKEARGKAA